MSRSLSAREKQLLRAAIRGRRTGRTGGLDGLPEGLEDNGAPGEPRILIGYAALPGEPALDETLDAARAAGTYVLLPVTTPGEPLHFGRLQGPMSGLAPRGTWHIREPDPTDSAAEAVAGPHSPVTVLVPGLAFDGDGYRLGNGAGYYDRTFGPHAPLWQQVSELTRSRIRFVGVCWADEYGLDVPREPWDLRVDQVLTVQPG